MEKQPSPPSLPESELGLEERYLAASTAPAERMELISALGRLQTAASADALAHIFARERRYDAKMKIIEVLADNPGALCRNQKFLVLSAGVAETQPLRIRLASLQALLDLDDPRRAAILERLTSDPDPLIRRQAAEALEKK